MSFDAVERQVWAGQAEAYAGTFGVLCGRVVGEVVGAARVGEGVRVLDVGTGSGAAAGEAVRLGGVVDAVDAEPSMVALAAKRVPRARVKLGVLPELPYQDAEFDVVVGNFVLNHVARPLAALAEMRRVLRPGGRIALTIWTSPPAPGQALFGRAVQAAGVVPPPDHPRLDPADEFPRTEQGLTALLAAAGFAAPATRTLAFDHLVDPDVWWSGPAAGIATIGRLVTSQPPPVQAAVRRHYDRLAAAFRTPEGLLSLPHTALLTTAARGL